MFSLLDTLPISLLEEDLIGSDQYEESLSRRLKVLGHGDIRSTTLALKDASSLNHFLPPVVPNDPDFYRQWSLKIIDAPLSWSLWTGKGSCCV